MLPVSGAEQLNGSAPIGERPMISHSGAYSRTLSASLSWLLGINRFHRPCFLGLGLELGHHRRLAPAVALVDLALEDRLGRQDVLFQKGRDALGKLGGTGRRGRQHGGPHIAGL